MIYVRGRRARVDHWKLEPSRRCLMFNGPQRTHCFNKPHNNAEILVPLSTADVKRRCSRYRVPKRF